MSPNHSTNSPRKGKSGNGQKKSIKELKCLVTSTPILVQSNQKALFRLETNTSGYTTRPVLSHLCDDGKWHPVGFTSKGLDVAKRNYEVHDKELLSVIQGLEEWIHVLEGTKHMIEILNDHRNLMYFRTSQNLNHQQACWSL